MTLARFKDSPWRASHPSYDKSALAMSPAPEYASSDVLVASLYRTVGFCDLGERGVPQAGRDHDKALQAHRRRHSSPAGALVSPDTWNTMVHGVLESPKLPNQSSRRFVQVSPLVPALTSFSGSARMSGNSWPAGSLVRRMVWLGSADEASARALWTDLFGAMGVDDGDDVFARWLQQEATAWAPTPAHWQVAFPAADESAALAVAGAGAARSPARQFVRDLDAIIAAKDAMTRRQWTSLLEAVVRLAAVAHVAWLCDVQARIWRNVRDALGGNPAGEDALTEPVFPEALQYMAYGSKALLGLKDLASGYLQARLGTNAVLWFLEEAGAPFGDPLSTSGDVAALCTHVRRHRERLALAGIEQAILELLEGEARALLCKKGIGSNIMEFARHCLGKRDADNPLLRGYDQGYALRKKGASASSPWVVSLGPVAVLALTHCALAGMGGPRSIQRLVRHLAAYGVSVDRNDISSSDLGHQLRMLGLVLDSPDAESGMLLLPPFPGAIAANDRRKQE